MSDIVTGTELDGSLGATDRASGDISSGLVVSGSLVAAPEVNGVVTTGVSLSGTMVVSGGNAGAVVVTGSSIDGQMTGGPKGDAGYTPVKGVDYFDGTDGTDGTDGKEVELQNNGTYIQWRYVGGSWSDLVALSSLKGADGTNGVDGQEVSLQVSGGYIQWRLGTGVWTDLIALSALKGDTGATGATGAGVVVGGTTGQILTKNSSTDYDTSWQNPPQTVTNDQLKNEDRTDTYTYVGYENSNDGSWYIYRRTRATNLRQYATGLTDYATNWAGRGGLSYA